MAGKKGKSKGKKSKAAATSASTTAASTAAAAGAAAHGIASLHLEGPFPGHNGMPGSKAPTNGARGNGTDRFADGSSAPPSVSSPSRSQISRISSTNNTPPHQHSGSAVVATVAVSGSGDFRHTNSSNGREADWWRRAAGDRDSGERDRGGLPGDHCHNGESLSGSPYLSQAATREWPWIGYSAKQFRLFAQEYPPVLDVGADQVRAKIEDVKCRTCRDRLVNALGKVLSRGGLPLTKLVKLAACRSGEDARDRPGEGSLGSGLNGHSASSMLLQNGGGVRAGAVDRLCIRAPVTPDLLRQIIGVVQVAAGVESAVSSSTRSAADVKMNRSSGAAGVRFPGLSAKEWLSTYLAPPASCVESDGSNGLRGTGTGSLAIPRVHQRPPSTVDSGHERDPWTLMERTERAKESAFKYCGVIEAMTGVGLHDPTGNNGGASVSGVAGGGTGGGGSSVISANMDWNPQFAPRLQEAETALVDWLTELTMTLHGLTFQFTLAFVKADQAEHCGEENSKGEGEGESKDDLAESTALAEVLWTAYEESVKRQLELTLEARRGHLREQSQPMGIALCFAPQNRACAAELLERKRAEMASLHEATVGVLRAVKVQPLLDRAERARQKWSSLLVAEELQALDDLVERVLKARLQVFKCESFAYNASNDVIQAEQMADAQLKAVVQELETMMDSFKVVVENRVAEELDPMVYPQSPALTAALQSWLLNFRSDWEGNETTQQLHAHIRQRHVHELCQTLVTKKQRLKTSKEEAAELGKQRRKRDSKAGVSNGNGMYSASSEQSEDAVKQRELEERCQSLVTDISLTQQEQIETCLTYRLFAVGQLHQRYRRLRLFFAQLVCRIATRSLQVKYLCGGDAEAEERVKMLGAGLMLGAVEEACLRWKAVQNARQLVEGMNREDASLDAKRRKRERAKAKVRENKTATAAAAKAAAKAATEEAERDASELSSATLNTRVAEELSGSESSRSPKGGFTATAEKLTNGGRRVGRQGHGTDGARGATTPENGAPTGAHREEHSRTVTRDSDRRGKDDASKESKNDHSTASSWPTAEKDSAPAGDEDGFVTIGKSKARRSAARDGAAHQNRRPWPRGGSGRGRQGGGGNGNDWRGSGGGSRDHVAPRTSKPHEHEQRGRGHFTAANDGKRSSGFEVAFAAEGEGTWVLQGNNSTVSEERPEVCLATATAAGGGGGGSSSSSGQASSAVVAGTWSSAADISPPASAAAAETKQTREDTHRTGCDNRGWHAEVRDSGGSGRERSTSPTPPHALNSTHGSPVPKHSTGVSAGDGKCALPKLQPQPEPPTDVDAVAPEEELPLAAPVPLETTEEGAAEGLIDKPVVGVEDKRRDRVGGDLALANGELGPEREREVAEVSREADRFVAASKSVKQEQQHGREIGIDAQGEEVGAGQDQEEEQEYVFQFGTVNLSDEEVVNVVVESVDVRGDVQEAQGSPESRRYDGGIEEDGRRETQEVTSGDGPDCGVSPGSLTGAEAQFDGASDSAEGAQDFDGEATEGSTSQTLETQQLRGGVFFPAHPPPPVQPAQHQQHDGYMGPQSYHHQPSHGGDIQHHHQQEMVAQQQRGFSQDHGMHGLTHLHQQQSHLPYPRGMGLAVHTTHGGNPGGGMHVSGVGGQGLSQHRRGPPHPKHSRHGSNVGRGVGQLSPNGGHLFPFGSQFNVGHHHSYGMMQQHGSATGYWGAGMMHYQVPGQHMMGPAPGGIGVTDGQAVYYPPPPHMMMQGDGSGHDQGGGLPWHSGGGHMGMGMLMDLNGMPAPVPWMPDGGQQQHYMHSPPQQDWGSPTHGTGYAQPGLHPPPLPPPPPPPQQQQHHSQSLQQLPAFHSGVPQSQDHHEETDNYAKGARAAGAVAAAATAPAADSTEEREATDISYAYEGKLEQPCEDHVAGYVVSIAGNKEIEEQEMAVVSPDEHGELPEVRGSEGEAAGDASQPLVASPSAPELANGTRSQVPDTDFVNAANKGLRKSPTELEEIVTAETGVVEVGRQSGEISVNGGETERVLDVRDANREGSEETVDSRPIENRNGSETPNEETVAETSGTSAGTPRTKKGKKERVQKGQGQAHAHGGSRQATLCNGAAGTQQQQVESLSGGRGKRKGGKGGGSRLSPAAAAAEEAAAAAAAASLKRDLPSPSGPMPRGLVNATGQNNCFLNVVVQSLWHLDAFRARFGGSGSAVIGAWAKKSRAWGGGGNDKGSEETSQRVESSLRALFRELSEGVEGDVGGKSEGSGAGGTRTTSASVDALRMALADVSGARFEAGKMDDAAEAMETILGCLMQGSSAAAIRQVFKMRIRQALTCPKCGVSSPEMPATYEANVFYAHVSALREARQKAPACSFDVALREASHGDLMTCRNGACPVSRRRELLPSRCSITGEPPSVFSLGLVWNNWGSVLVTDLLRMLSPVVDLDVVFSRGFKRGGGGGRGAWSGLGDGPLGKANLRGFFCFQVQKHHYVAFVYNKGREEWLLLDDDQAIPIGPEFSGVLARCESDNLHPSLFFYERQHPLA